MYKTKPFPGLFELIVVAITASMILVSCTAFAIGSPCDQGRCPPGARPMAPVSPGEQQPPNPAMVRLLNEKTDGNSFFSGTIVDVEYEGDIILTCAHAIETVGKLTAKLPDGRLFSAEVLIVDSLWDIGVLSIADTGVIPIKISDDYPRPGDTVKGYGYGSGEFAVTAGVVEGYMAWKRQPSAHVIKFSNQSRMGDSGGPVLNTKCELVGVMTHAGPGVTYATRSAKAVQAIERALKLVEQPALPSNPEGRTGEPNQDRNMGGTNNVRRSGLDWASIMYYAANAAAIVIAGGATGGTGYVALRGAGAMWAMWRKRKRGQAMKEPEPFCEAERDSEEARQLLRLSMLEGRNPLHDAIVGRFVFDELDRDIEMDSGGPRADWAALLRDRLKARFNEVAPLSVEKRNV